MKKFFFFSLCSFLISQLMAQPFQKKQITNFNFDSKGTAFPTYRYGYSFLPNPPIFFVAHQGNYANIMMMNYNASTDSFFNLTSITSNNYMNINLIADATAANGDINLIWQTNENGNWDIALRTLKDSGWTNKKLIVDSQDEEINPIFVPMNLWSSLNDYDFEILYEKNNSIFIYQQKDTVINHDIIFEGNDSITYSNPTAIDYWGGPIPLPSGFYIASSRKSNHGTAKIVYRYKTFIDSTWSPIHVAYDSGYSEKPHFFYNFNTVNLSFENKTAGKNQVFIFPELRNLGQNQSAIRLLDDSDVHTSDLSLVNYSFITNKNVPKYKINGQFFPIYAPHTYKMIKNDSLFIAFSQIFFQNDFYFYTSLGTSKPAVGNLGLTQDFYYAVSYTVWEDSVDGRINLFGVKRIDAIGDVNDKIIANNFRLYQNYPNPFNPKTMLKYELLSREFVTLKVFDVLGNEVVTLVNEEKDSGRYNLTFDGTNLASGIYVYRLSVGRNHLSKKMILLK